MPPAPSSRTYDAVVVGASLNGLVAAAELATSGWSVALVEPPPYPPLVAHREPCDTVSPWHALFRQGPTYAVLRDELRSHGLRYAVHEGPLTATVDDRGTLVAHHDPGATAAQLVHPEDASRYVALLRAVDADPAGALDGLAAGLTPDRVLAPWPGSAETPSGTVDELERLARVPARDLLTGGWTGDEVERLWRPWLRWCGLEADGPGSAHALVTLAHTLHTEGLPVVAGGEGFLLQALRSICSAHGVDVIDGPRETRLEIGAGRVRAVRVGGARLHVDGVVIAAGSVDDLARLLPDTVGPGPRIDRATTRSSRLVTRARLRLDRPLGWSDERLAATPLVHLDRGEDHPAVTITQPLAVDRTRVRPGESVASLEWRQAPGRRDLDALREVLTAVGRHAPDLEDRVQDALLSRRQQDPGTTGAHVAAAGLRPLADWQPGVGAGHRTGVPGLLHVGAYDPAHTAVGPRHLVRADRMWSPSG